MISALAFFLTLNQILASPVRNQKLIAGGVPVDPPFKYPWIASIETSNFHLCGGSLLDSTTLLTAAHCSIGHRPNPFLQVFAKRHNLDLDADTEQALTFQVDKITRHPKFDRKTNAYNFAIWKVSLQSGDENFLRSIDNAIELDDGSLANSANTTLIISGWGASQDQGEPSKILLETQIDIVDFSECKKVYDYLDSTAICAARSGKDSCDGDSGGPLFSVNSEGNVKLVGITSFGEGCADPIFPGVYAKISSVLDWIQQTRFDITPASPYDDGDGDEVP